MKTILLAAALFLCTNLAGLAAKPAKKAPAKKPATVVTYKAKCGMTYSATDAKKYNYICPMDKQPLTKVVSKAPSPKKK